MTKAGSLHCGCGFLHGIIQWPRLDRCVAPVDPFVAQDEDVGGSLRCTCGSSGRRIMQDLGRCIGGHAVLQQDLGRCIGRYVVLYQDLGRCIGRYVVL